METWTKTCGPYPGCLILTHTHVDPKKQQREKRNASAPIYHVELEGNLVFGAEDGGAEPSLPAESAGPAAGGAAGELQGAGPGRSEARFFGANSGEPRERLLRQYWWLHFQEWGCCGFCVYRGSRCA